MKKVSLFTAINNCTLHFFKLNLSYWNTDQCFNLDIPDGNIDYFLNDWYRDIFSAILSNTSALEMNPSCFTGNCTFLVFLSLAFCSNCIDIIKALSHGVLYTTESISDLTDGEAQRQLDLFVKKRGIETDEKHDWKNSRVIKKLKRSKWFLKKILLQMIKYMRDVFIVQLIRRFIHNFFLHDIIMKLWIFDCSDPYSSEKLDIHKKIEKFIRTITKYVIINDKNLKLNILIELNDKGRFITISKNTTKKCS